MIVGTAHIMKMKGSFFHLLFAQMKNGRERVAFLERAPVWSSPGRSLASHAPLGGAALGLPRSIEARHFFKGWLGDFWFPQVDNGHNSHSIQDDSWRCYNHSQN